MCTALYQHRVPFTVHTVHVSFTHSTLYYSSTTLDENTYVLIFKGTIKR